MALGYFGNVKQGMLCCLKIILIPNNSSLDSFIISFFKRTTILFKETKVLIKLQLISICSNVGVHFYENHLFAQSWWQFKDISDRIQLLVVFGQPTYSLQMQNEKNKILTLKWKKIVFLYHNLLYSRLNEINARGWITCHNISYK